MRIQTILGTLTALAAANPDHNTTYRVNLDDLNRVISKQMNNSWAEVQNNTWNFPTYLGSWFLSEYYFELKALGLLEKSKFNETFFTKMLLDT